MAKAVVATPVANEGIRAPEGEAVLLAERAGRVRARRSWPCWPTRAGAATLGAAGARVRRGQVDLGGPVPGAGGGVPRHLTRHAASDRRPVFAALHNDDPLQPAVAAPSYCASQQNLEMPPMAKPTLPEFKLPELKLPKFDLDALFGLQKANLSGRPGDAERRPRGAPGDRPPAARLRAGGRRDPQDRRQDQGAGQARDRPGRRPGRRREGRRRDQAGRRPRRRRPAAGGRAGQPARQGQCRRAEDDRRLSSGSRKRPAEQSSPGSAGSTWPRAAPRSRGFLRRALGCPLPKARMGAECQPPAAHQPATCYRCRIVTVASAALGRHRPRPRDRLARALGRVRGGARPGVAGAAGQRAGRPAAGALELRRGRPVSCG